MPGEPQDVAGGRGELCLRSETNTGWYIMCVFLKCVYIYVVLGWVYLLYVCFLLAPPILLGVWLMAPVLWLPLSIFKDSLVNTLEATQFVYWAIGLLSISHLNLNSDPSFIFSFSSFLVSPFTHKPNTVALTLHASWGLECHLMQCIRSRGTLYLWILMDTTQNRKYNYCFTWTEF